MTRKLHRVLLPFLCVALLAGGSLAQLAVTATPASAAMVSGVVLTSSGPSVTGESVVFSVNVAGVSGTPQGTVDVLDGVSPICAGVDLTQVFSGLSGGFCSVSSLSVGTHVMTAAYSGDGTYDPETSPPDSQVVNKASTTTTPGRVPTSNPSPSSAPVSFTATVAAVAPGTGTPTGTVEFMDGPAVITGCASSPVNGDGLASCDVPNLVFGSHTITTSYSGDDSYTNSSNTLPHSVGYASTTTVLTSSDSITTSNEPVTYTATIAPVGPATATPDGGTVEFLIGGVTIAGCESQDVVLGTATCETVSEPVGSPTITAEYSGAGNFDGSTATGITQTVGNADTTTQIVVTPLNTSFTYGDDITLAATIAPVSPATVAPDAGTVSITADGVSITACQLLDVSAGTATCTTDVLDAGVPSIDASFSGSTGFNTSAFSTSAIIAPAATETAVTSGSNPSVNTETVTFTATVTSDGGTPSGSVTFTADGEPITGCSAATTVNGVATCDTAALPVTQNQEIVASFVSNDGNHNESTSPAFYQDVVKATNTTAVVTSNAATVFSQSVTFTATITPTAPATAPPASGTVNFNLFGSSLPACTAQPVNSSGVATCTTTAVPVGDHLVAALYSGDGNFKPSVSPLIDQSVAEASTTTAVTSSDNPSTWRESVTFTATVTPTAPATLAPSSGTASFSADGSEIEGCAAQDVTGGVATCATDVLSIASHSIVVIYSGSDTLTGVAAPTADFESSTSPAITQTVARSNTRTALTPLDTPADVGTSVRFRVAVTASGEGEGTPTGIVALYRTRTDGSRQWIGRLNTRTGVGTITIDGIPVGLHLIVAEYRGNADFAPSHRSARQRIDH